MGRGRTVRVTSSARFTRDSGIARQGRSSARPRSDPMSTSGQIARQRRSCSKAGVRSEFAMWPVDNGQTFEVRAARRSSSTPPAPSHAETAATFGCGDRRGTQRIGVPIVHELDGVGNNLRDHYAVRMVARIKNIRTINSMAQGPPLLLEIARWLVGRPSLLAVSSSLSCTSSGNRIRAGPPGH